MWRSKRETQGSLAIRTLCLIFLGLIAVVPQLRAADAMAMSTRTSSARAIRQVSEDRVMAFPSRGFPEPSVLQKAKRCERKFRAARTLPGNHPATGPILCL
jgi:hypothetical protein